MGQPKTIGAWAELATSKIAYGPDRQQVYAELLGHLEDGKSALEARGYSPEEAALQAMEQMGDRELLATQLQEIYRPFWAYVAKYTRICSILAKLYLVYFLVMFVAGSVFTLGYDYNDYFLSDDCSGIVGDYQPNEVAKSKGYTISVERIQVVDYGENRRANFVLKVEHWNPWLQNPSFYRNLSATDDRGNLYPPRFAWKGFDQGEVAGNTAYSTPFVTYHEMWIANIDPAATAVDLGFDNYGISWNIPLSLTEGGATNG